MKLIEDNRQMNGWMDCFHHQMPMENQLFEVDDKIRYLPRYSQILLFFQECILLEFSSAPICSGRIRSLKNMKCYYFESNSVLRVQA